MPSKIQSVFLLLSIFLITSCSTKSKGDDPQAQKGKGVMIEKTLFGKLDDGREVYRYALTNSSGTRVDIINYGGIVTNLFVKDKDGKTGDVVLGYDSLSGYIHDNSFFGAIVGRYGNRIGKGKFTLDGKQYQLTINDGQNSLHGGPNAFFKAVWDAQPIESPDSPALKLTHISPDGENGYPGTVNISVTYTLTKDNELKIDYEATTDKPTILNPTHHSYFNLTADMNKTILDHVLYMDADSITPVDNNLIPTGEIRPVKNTPMDFTKETPIGKNINAKYDQLEYGRGYDHNWVLNNYSKGNVRKVITVYDPSSGREMDVYTDQPGMQFYSGNFLNGSAKGKNGINYQHRTGFCLEAQHYPDSPNKPNFPSTVLRPGEKYSQTTIYKFSTK